MNKIVVLDDEAEWRDKAFQALTKEGVKPEDVHLFSKPEPAIKFIQEQEGQIRALITDQFLGCEMTGDKVIGIVGLSYPHLNCILMSSAHVREEARQYRAAFCPKRNIDAIYCELELLEHAKMK